MTYPVEIFFTMENDFDPSMLASGSVVIYTCMILLLLVQRLVGLDILLRFRQRRGAIGGAADAQALVERLFAFHTNTEDGGRERTDALEQVQYDCPQDERRGANALRPGPSVRLTQSKEERQNAS